MKEQGTIFDTKQIAYCGLYCAECPKFIKKKCPGCAKNEKASWCKVRKCCIQKNIASCADCDEFSDAKDCKTHNNFMGRIFSLLFNSDRYACLQMIKEGGYEDFARFMAENHKVTIKRKRK